MAQHGADRAGGQLPDLIVVVIDQHRAGLTRREGFPLDTNPFIAELATSGVRITGSPEAHDAHVSIADLVPICYVERGMGGLPYDWPDAETDLPRLLQDGRTASRGSTN